MEGVDEGWTRYYSECLEECSRGIISTDRDFPNLQDIPLIHPLTHLHDRDSSPWFSVKESCLDRGGSTVLREDRAMDIDTHLSRDIEESFWEDLSIGDDDEIITLI